jgi:excinuclease ABC subunit A
VQDVILYGSGEESITFVYDDGLRSYKTTKPFEGVIGNIERRWRETDSQWVREELSRSNPNRPCEVCDGNRLKPEALAVKVNGLSISAQVSQLSIREPPMTGSTNCPEKLTDKQTRLPRRILKEIRDRLRFLVDVGLEYLTLSRSSGTLSGGESQRIRLASQIGSGLTGVLYVLDEPSIGLHQRDNDRLLETLKHLRDLGNTVIVVEHDEDAVRSADYVVDIGPGAGVHGGRIVAEGTPEGGDGQSGLADRQVSVRRHVRSRARQTPQGQKGPVDQGQGRAGNNLKGVDATVPLGTFTCVTGVSGGGKSTLLIDTLYKVAARKLERRARKPGPA